MTRPNAQAATSDGSLAATHTYGDGTGREAQVFMQADEAGVIHGAADTWLLYQAPRVLAAAAADQWDLFNAAGSGVQLRLRSLFSIRNRTVALATLPDWQFDTIRTSAIGTGGAASTANAGASPAAGGVMLAPADTANTALPAGVTARSLPTGGATAATFLFSSFLSGLHSATARDPAFELMSGVNLVPELPHGNPFLIREGQGIKVRQITATISTGTAFGWLAAFTIA